MNRIAFTRMRIAIVLPVLLAFGIADLRAQVNAPEMAAQRLRSVGVYAFGGVGFAGIISRGELDYRAVLREPPGQALKEFEDVFGHGNNQAKSYALKGIHELDPDRFKELYEGVATSEEKVVTMSGCMMSSRKLKDVAKGMDATKSLK